MQAGAHVSLSHQSLRVRDRLVIPTPYARSAEEPNRGPHPLADGSLRATWDRAPTILTAEIKRLLFVVGAYRFSVRPAAHRNGQKFSGSCQGLDGMAPDHPIVAPRDPHLLGDALALFNRCEVVPVRHRVIVPNPEPSDIHPCAHLVMRPMARRAPLPTRPVRRAES
jgi:hypothetical protein